MATNRGVAYRTVPPHAPHDPSLRGVSPPAHPGLMVSAATALLVGAAAAFVYPKWPPTYQMNASTYVMACNYSGSLHPAFAAQWGIAVIDWSNWKTGADGWSTKRDGMDCEEKLLRQAKMVKAINPRTKVFVYRNMAKALPWCESAVSISKL